MTVALFHPFFHKHKNFFFFLKSIMSSSSSSSTSLLSKKTLRIAVVGCVHGEMEKMFESVSHVSVATGRAVDLVVCCGDFQSLRNIADLRSLSCPDRYKRMGEFHRYYSGELKVPAPTLFIGGNHEASSSLLRLPNGGYVANGVYYMGYAGVVWFGGVRIAGLSGIYKSHDFLRGRFESEPLDDSSVRSIYHQRQFDAQRLAALRCAGNRLDIALSHDWPRGVEKHGDLKWLLHAKRRDDSLRREINANVFGSPATGPLVHSLQPRYWFAAHMHIKYAALIHHKSPSQSRSQSSSQSSSQGQSTQTKFLALSKVLRDYDFLQVLDVEVRSDTGMLDDHQFRFDAEWLAIVHKSESAQRFDKGEAHTPPIEPASTAEIDEVNALLEARNGGTAIEQSRFTRLVRTINEPDDSGLPLVAQQVDPQHQHFVDMLFGASSLSLSSSSSSHAQNDEEIALDDDDQDLFM
jgi:lariat debranching enzyme